MYVRGQATEYNDWARITGYQSWAWSGLQPFFLKHEAMTVPAQDSVDTESRTIVFENEFHGSSGPIKTSFGNWSAPVQEAWHQTGKKMGLQWTPPKDAWSGSHLGGYSNLSTIDRSQGPGTRSYAVTGYLTPNSARHNLKVLTEATVTKVLLDQNAEITTSKGVAFQSNGKEFAVYAQREIILAAGVVQTPQILELSGIGRPDVLQSAGLECIVKNQRVGEQFVDHPVTALSYDLVDGEMSLDHMTQEAVMGEAMRKYGLGEGGPLANGMNGNAFLAVAQIATPEEMARINHAVKLELESAPDRWTKADRKILAERINDPQTASLQLAILPATTDPSRFDDQTKLLAPGVGTQSVLRHRRVLASVFEGIDSYSEQRPHNAATNRSAVFAEQSGCRDPFGWNSCCGCNVSKQTFSKQNPLEGLSKSRHGHARPGPAGTISSCPHRYRVSSMWHGGSGTGG